MKNERIYKMAFASVYPHYITKAEKKGRTKEEVDTIICWLTGYTQDQLQQTIENKTTFEDFFAQRFQNYGRYLRLPCRGYCRAPYAKNPLYG